MNNQQKSQEQKDQKLALPTSRQYQIFYMQYKRKKRKEFQAV